MLQQWISLKHHTLGFGAVTSLIPTVNSSQDSGHMTRPKSVPLFPPDLSVNEKLEMGGWLDGTSLRGVKTKTTGLHSTGAAPQDNTDESPASL